MTYIKPPAPNECRWRSGPPPDVGWWPAGVTEDASFIRYWDGKNWSWGFDCKFSSKELPERALSWLSVNSQDYIQWTDRWWLK